MNPIQNRLQRALIIVAAVVIVVCSWFPPIQSLAEAQVDAGLKRALISFASARTLNAIISVIQGTELSVQPLGIGVTLTLGQALDPINDLIEQFSSLMLFASIAFGVQKALLAVGANWVVSLLVTIAAIVWAGLVYLKKSPPWFSKLFIVLLMIRFAIPVATIGSDLLYQQLLAREYVEQQKSIDAVSREIATSVPKVPIKGSVDSPQTPAATDESWFKTAPPKTAQKSWFSGLGNPLNLAMPNISLNYEAIKKTLETLPERVVKVIVIFLLQTMIIPILLLWALYKIALGVARPVAWRTEANQASNLQP